MEEIKQKKRFNKKYLMFGIPLLAVVLVSAALLVHYGVIDQLIHVNQPIVVSGITTQDLNCASGSICWGSQILVENNGNDERTIHVSATPNGEIKTAYWRGLTLTKKDTQTWGAIGDPIVIWYTAIGDVFEYSGVPDGYTLIYYKDKGEYTTDEERLTVLGENIPFNENIPSNDDWNIGEYADYCNNGIDHYTNCRGGKLWAVPDENIVDGVLVWSNPENFYFETDLIQFNKEGILTLYPHSNNYMTPVYSPDPLLIAGDYTVETQVNPA